MNVTPQSLTMSSNLGKRKRRAVAPNTTEAEDKAAAEFAQEVFRRHFEAQFQPLPETKKPKVVEEEIEEEEEEEEEEWDGISEDENDVRIVEHTDAYARMAAMSKEQLKSFMVLYLLFLHWRLRFTNGYVDIETTFQYAQRTYHTG